jgi:hypothetical protein
MKKRFILFLTNGDYSQDDLDKWLLWYQKTFPFEVVLTKKVLDLPLKFKYFLTINDPITHTARPLYGLDGIKKQLTPYVELGQYDEIIFYYPRPDIQLDLSNWTYPNDLNGAAFSELTSTSEWDAQDNFYQNLRHETYHRFHRCLQFKGIPTQDTMDSYDFPDNETRNFAVIAPYFDKLGHTQPEVNSLTLQYAILLQRLIGLLQRQLDDLKHRLATKSST